ncbi:MAG TPA: hypothetical protein VE571_04645 [Solirubrobacteraceae bacterium]|jgi:hypothetical protein|nr:hypothetical protein [Solirubrobacteraceae bacterium]
MADWVTISSLATAGGTLVLAVATFSSVKSANRSARIAERSLMVGLRPVLVPSHEDDPIERVRFGDGQIIAVPGHGGTAEVHNNIVFLALGLRNGGNGLAVVHGWRVRVRQPPADPGAGRVVEAPGLDEFRQQQLDIFVPAGDGGVWQGAMRDPAMPGHDEVRENVTNGGSLEIDLLYGDHEGGQRTIVRFLLAPWPTDGDRPNLENPMRAIVIRYWTVDGQDPR